MKIVVMRAIVILDGSFSKQLINIIAHLQRKFRKKTKKAELWKGKSLVLKLLFYSLEFTEF